MTRKIIFLCKADSSRLVLEKGKYTPYYRCPKYLKENRESGECVCNNRINLKTAKKIESVIEVEDFNGSIEFGKTYMVNGIKVMVGKQYQNSINVYIERENI